MTKINPKNLRHSNQRTFNGEVNNPGELSQVWIQLFCLSVQCDPLFISRFHQNIKFNKDRHYVSFIHCYIAHCRHSA